MKIFFQDTELKRGRVGQGMTRICGCTCEGWTYLRKYLCPVWVRAISHPGGRGSSSVRS